jgi:hypothetical protein
LEKLAFRNGHPELEWRCVTSAENPANHFSHTRTSVDPG